MGRPVPNLKDRPPPLSSTSSSPSKSPQVTPPSTPVRINRAPKSPGLQDLKDEDKSDLGAPPAFPISAIAEDEEEGFARFNIMHSDICCAIYKDCDSQLNFLTSSPVFYGNSRFFFQITVLKYLSCNSWTFFALFFCSHPFVLSKTEPTGFSISFSSKVF